MPGGGGGRKDMSVVVEDESDEGKQTQLCSRRLPPKLMRRLNCEQLTKHGIDYDCSAVLRYQH